MPTLKTISSILITILILACKKPVERFPVPSDISDSIEIKKAYNNLEKEFADFDKRQLNFIGSAPLDEIVIEPEEIYVRFRRSYQYGSRQTVIEVFKKHNYTSFVKFTDFNINGRDCNPVQSPDYDNILCFTLNRSYKKEISSSTVDSLMNILQQQEFWDLSRNETNIQGSIILDGEIWVVDAKTARTSFEDTLVYSHSIARQYYGNFESVKVIGNYMMKLAKK